MIRGIRQKFNTYEPKEVLLSISFPFLEIYYIKSFYKISGTQSQMCIVQKLYYTVNAGRECSLSFALEPERLLSTETPKIVTDFKLKN
jgi:hypothetical protein